MASLDKPRDHLVTGGRETDLQFRVGRIQLIGLEAYAAVVCIAEVSGQLLICVPNSVWDKKKDRRFLPTSSFKKPIAVSVAAVPFFDREGVVDTPLKVWIGLLALESEKFLDFSGEGEVLKNFHEDGEDELLPYAESLVAVAAEHFTFLSAEEGLTGQDGEGGEPSIEARMAMLEKSMAGIQSALQNLVPGAGAARPSALKKDRDKTGGEGGVLGAAPKVASRPQKGFEGLDRTVVDAALAAGVSPEHLTEMAQVLRVQAGRMEDVPRSTGGNRVEELSDSGGTSEEEEEAAQGSGLPGDGGIAKAIVKLTKVCSTLADTKKKSKQDGIENLLDQASLGQGSEGSGLGGGRRNAQALRALKRCLAENPEYLYRTIEANLLSDFAARSAKPGSPMGQASARGWLESRSRIQNYSAHVRWSWAVAGIWDDLIKGDNGSARARAALLIAASDQAAIDSGSWLLSNISLLEPLPPFQSFSSHQPPSSQELQHSALWDPRWFELFLAHVKEMDSYQETRKKFSKQGLPNPKKPEDPPKVPKPKGKPKAKAASREKEEEAGSN